MKAVRCHRFAALDQEGRQLAEPIPLRDVLSMDEVKSPQAKDCGADEVQVQVAFAGIQYPDALQAKGLYQEKPELPYIPGLDVTGTILHTGSDVTEFAVGDRVVGLSPKGGLCEIVQIPAAQVFPLTTNIPLSKCANLGRNFLAAYHSLKTVAELRAGDLVLIDGASGGVGMAAIQLAKAMKLIVIAGVSSKAKIEAPQSAGADRVLVYGTELEHYKQFKAAVRTACGELGRPDGVDAVIDMVQGELFEAALVSCVRPLGKLCLVGFAAGQKPIRPGMLLIKQAAAIGSLWSPWARSHPSQHRRNVNEILGFFASGAIEPRADRVFRFDEFAKAFELFENNQGCGNTVVQITAQEDLG